MTPEKEKLGNSCAAFHAFCHGAITTLVIALSLIFLSLSEGFLLEKQITPNAIEYWLYNEYNLWVILTRVQRIGCGVV